MKRIFRIIFNITLLAVLAGCNDVVFLEPLNPSVEQVSFSEAGGEAEVEMNHGDFIIEKITLDGEDVRGLMTMEDGRQFYGFLRLDGPGTAFYRSRLLEFELTRTDDRHMKLKVGESTVVRDRIIALHLTDGFQHQVITAAVSGCGGYSFDKIEYGEDISYFTRYEDAWSKYISNGPDKKIYYFNAMEGADRIVHFPSVEVWADDAIHILSYDELMLYVKEPFEVPVPSEYLEDGKLVFDGQKVTFSTSEIHLPLDIPNPVIGVTYGPGSSGTVTVKWRCHQYNVRYTIWLRSEDGREPMAFTGMFKSKTYDGKYIIDSN